MPNNRRALWHLVLALALMVGGATHPERVATWFDTFLLFLNAMGAGWYLGRAA